MDSRAIVIVLATLASAPLPAATTWHASMRSRVEAVDSDALNQHALANTARVRASLESAFANHLTTLAELEGVAVLTDDYNSGVNGHTQYPTVLDPRGVELNQLLVGWAPDPWRLTVGRQRIVYDNQRFIGNVGWRQNEQTFDAADLMTTLGSVTWRYTRFERVHRVAGRRALDPRQRHHELEAHALHAQMRAAAGTLALYGYFIDNQTIAAASSRTVGARWNTDSEGPWSASIEIAQQQDHGHHPASFSAPYRSLELGYKASYFTTRVGWERLGSNGTVALQTPLATLHAFNGWADMFLVTPTLGLRDHYLGLNGVFGQSTIAWQTRAHHFTSDIGGREYGQEWDASVTIPTENAGTWLLKAARYDAEQFGSDTSKLWVQWEWSH